MEFLLLMASPMIISFEQMLAEPFLTDLVADTQLPKFLLLKPDKLAILAMILSKILFLIQQGT